MVTTLLKSESMLQDTIAGTNYLLMNIGYSEAIGHTIPVVLSNSEGLLSAGSGTQSREFERQLLGKLTFRSKDSGAAKCPKRTPVA